MTPNPTRGAVKRTLQRLEATTPVDTDGPASDEPIYALTPFSRAHYSDRDPTDDLTDAELAELERATGSGRP